MTATQSRKIYELLNTQFGQPERARQLTEAIEAVIDEKVTEGNKSYETLFHKDLEVLRLEFKEAISKSENKIILWIVGFNTILAGLIITLVKLL